MAEKINHPKHYLDGKIECIDAIEETVGIQGAIDFCIGNTMKYLWRHKKKENKIEDLRKAKWYLDYAIEKMTRIEEDSKQKT